MTERMFPPSDSLLSDVKKEPGLKYGEGENEKKNNRVQKARATGNLWGSMVSSRKNITESNSGWTERMDRSPNKNRRMAGGRDTRPRVYNELDNPALRKSVLLTPDQLKQEAEYVLRREGPLIMSAPDDILTSLVVRAVELEKEVSKQLASRTELLGKMQVIYDQEMDETRTSLNTLEKIVRESVPGIGGPTDHQRAVVHEMRMKLIDADNKQGHPNKENVIASIGVDISRPPPPMLDTSVPPPKLINMASSSVSMHTNAHPSTSAPTVIDSSSNPASHPYAVVKHPSSSFNPSFPPPNVHVPPPNLEAKISTNGTESDLPDDIKILQSVIGMLSRCQKKSEIPSPFSTPPPPMRIPPPGFGQSPSSSGMERLIDTSKPPPIPMNMSKQSTPMPLIPTNRFMPQHLWKADAPVNPGVPMATHHHGGATVPRGPSGPITPFVHTGHRRPYPGMGMIGRPGPGLPIPMHGGSFNRPPPGIPSKYSESSQANEGFSQDFMDRTRESRKRPLENSAGW